MLAMKKKEVKKPVSTIHIDNREMTLIQRKVFNLLLWNYYQVNDAGKDFYQVKMGLLTRYLGYKSRANKQILNSVKKLANILIEWDILGDDGREIGFCGMVKNEAWIKKGTLHYGFPDRLKELINNQKIYSFLKLHITALFHSKFSLALYENTHRFIGIGSTGWWDIDTFKTLIGVQDSKVYEQFREVKRRVITPATKEINDVSDITLSVEYKRKGRKVIGLKFNVQKKDKPIISKIVQLPDIITDKDKAILDEREHAEAILDALPPEELEAIRKKAIKKLPKFLKRSESVIRATMRGLM